jgi:membrane protein implicated in regulation of membrane protease activity
MNASRLPSNTHDERPPLEPVPGPIARQKVERHWFGVPARFVLLCLLCAAFGAAVGLFATGSWAWGTVMLLLAIVFFAALSEAARQRGRLLPEQSARIAADRRAHAATAAEVWRARLEASMTRWRTHSRLDQLELERPAVLQALGEAVHRKDKTAEQAARQRLDELDEQKRVLEAGLDAQLSGAEERIRLARLPVQETLLVAPNEPADPYPPPDEGNPPQPATVPEPYPPPDEGTPPTPAPANPDEQ